jgi:hypothetical protein
MMPGGGRQLLEVLLNPGVPIPEDASDVHGLTDEQVGACMAAGRCRAATAAAATGGARPPGCQRHGRCLAPRQAATPAARQAAPRAAASAPSVCPLLLAGPSAAPPQPHTGAGLPHLWLRGHQAAPVLRGGGRGRVQLRQVCLAIAQHGRPPPCAPAAARHGFLP